MMRVLCILAALSCISCVSYKHEAISANGNRETDTILSLGGTSSQKGADGSSFTHDHQASFQAGAQVVGSIAAGAIAGAIQQANNANLAAEQLAKTRATQAANQGLLQNAAPKVVAPTALGQPVVTAPAVPTLIKP